MEAEVTGRRRGGGARVRPDVPHVLQGRRRNLVPRDGRDLRLSICAGEPPRRLRWAREAINQFLDSPTMFNGSGLAHANPDKRAVYEVWRRQPVLFTLMRNEFAVTMAEFFNHVRFVSELNRELLGSDDNERNDPPDI